MRLIQIHAGIHKTGSKAIQHKLARLAPDLAAHGVALPNFGGRGNGHHALAGFTTAPEACAQAWGTLEAALDAAPQGRVLLSSEHLIGADPERLKAALDRLGPQRTRLHVYVRPHVALFTSLYLQRVKAGSAIAAPATLAETYAQGPEFDYVPAIERFIEVFGPEAVRVREFDPDRFDGGSLIADAFAFLDLPAALLPRATEGGDEIVNPTPTAEQAALLLALARRLRPALPEGQDAQPIRKALSTFFTALRAGLPDPGNRYRLPMPLQHAIAAHTAPQRAAFAHRLDRPASAAFLSEPLAAGAPLGTLPLAPLRDALAATAARLRDMGQPALARVTDALAHELQAAAGPAGLALADLPAPRTTEAAA